MTQWIKCSERLPEVDQEVLGIDDANNYEALLYTWSFMSPGTYFFAASSGEFHPTHWMPLPEPPTD